MILLRRLVTDERLPRRQKWLLGGVVAYLVFPVDLVPDFIPVVGQLDDALVLALGLRSVLRSGGAELLGEHWPGPEESLRVLLRLAA